MTQRELLSFYAGREAVFSATRENLAQKINGISNARLFVAVIFAVLLYAGFSNYPLLLWMTVIPVIVFIILVRNHAKLFEKKNHVGKLVAINKNEQEGLKGNFSAFDAGPEFMDPHHPYTLDLDIFGEGSLFQITNRCNTLVGKEKFARQLENTLPSSEAVYSCQQATCELAAKTDFRQHFQAAGMQIEELSQDRNQLLQWSKQPAFIYGKGIYRPLLAFVPVLTIGLILAAFFSDVFTPFAILLAGFQWAFTGFHIKRINLFHDYISRKKNILQNYARLLHLLERESFTSPLLVALSGKAAHADREVAALASLVRAFDARLNTMTLLVVNSVLLYDLQCVYRLEKWKTKNAANLHTWLEAASEAEVLCSFGTFAFNHPDYIYPFIHPELFISARHIGHPLIPKEECVVNDFEIGKEANVEIITGANMAGKSTFLRTIGVNIVLALNGAPVNATEFHCPVIHLRTGMRTADSLKNHQSYFYAELDRLQRIMEELRSDVPLLILLDEILKGTNSVDKQTGSIALVKQLLPHPCLAVIATHDLALGHLETDFPGRIKNYCFEANIENGQLSFDYKLKEGIARKMNATFLMKKMGIIPS